MGAPLGKAAWGCLMVRRSPLRDHVLRTRVRYRGAATLERPRVRPATPLDRHIAFVYSYPNWIDPTGVRNGPLRNPVQQIPDLHSKSRSRSTAMGSRSGVRLHREGERGPDRAGSRVPSHAVSPSDHPGSADHGKTPATSRARARERCVTAPAAPSLTDPPTHRPTNRLASEVASAVASAVASMMASAVAAVAQLSQSAPDRCAHVAGTRQA